MATAIGIERGVRLGDSRNGYGLVSRTFHWLMAAILAWQFASALCHAFLPDTAIETFFWSMHFNFGIILWVLVMLRGVWGLINLANRPPYKGPSAQRFAAGLVHFLLYALMLAIPTIAILRSYGGPRGMRFFGQQIFEPREEVIEPLMDLGNAWHGELGWVLLALITGHIALACWHGYVRRDGTLRRMTRGDERALEA